MNYDAGAQLLKIHFILKFMSWAGTCFFLLLLLGWRDFPKDFLRFSLQYFALSNQNIKATDELFKNGFTLNGSKSVR